MRPSRWATVVIVLCLAAAACGDDDPDAEGAAAGAAGGSISVQASGGESELQAFQDLADSFEADHPGAEVELVGVADQGDHIAKLATAFAGGAPPDVFLINYRRMGRFVDGDVIEPAALGDIATSDLYAPPVEAFTFGGRLMCIPQNVSSVVTYVNPSLFAKAGVELPTAGWTWVEALGTARALAGKGIEAVGFDAEFRSVAPFVWSAGGEVVDDTADPTKVTFDTAPARKALRFLLDLQETGLDATDRAASEPQARFAAGDLAMYFDSRRAVPAFRKSGVDFDVVPLPQDQKLASMLASDGWCVSKASKEKALAQEFARYAVGTEGAPSWPRRDVPSRPSALWPRAPRSWIPPSRRRALRSSST